jgi:hypothetical protein
MLYPVLLRYQKRQTASSRSSKDNRYHLVTIKERRSLINLSVCYDSNLAIWLETLELMGSGGGTSQQWTKVIKDQIYSVKVLGSS